MNVSNNHHIYVKNGGYICIEDGTDITLSDWNSLITVSDNAIMGINPNLSVASVICSSIQDISITGNGAIVDYGQDVYIQNETISGNRYIGGKNIYVGNHVTTTKPQGDVIITNNAKVGFDAMKNVYYESGFECKNGSSFETR